MSAQLQPCIAYKPRVLCVAPISTSPRMTLLIALAIIVGTIARLLVLFEASPERVPNRIGAILRRHDIWGRRHMRHFAILTA